MNNVVLVGRLTRDPDRRTTQQGTEVAAFTLAVDRGDKNKTTDFPSVVAFGKCAEVVNHYMSKGRLVAVHGRLETRTYEDRDGNTRYGYQVSADVVRFLDSGKKKATEGEYEEEYDGEYEGEYETPEPTPPPRKPAPRNSEPTRRPAPPKKK